MKKTAVTFFLSAGIVIFLSGTVYADQITINPADFVPGQPGHSGLDCYIGWVVKPYSASTYNHFFAPVHLPDGAQVTSMVVFFEDDSTSSFKIDLSRRNLYSGTVQDMATWTTTGDTSGLRNYKVSPMLYWTINNGGYFYFLYLYFYSSTEDLQLYAVKIFYNAP